MWRKFILDYYTEITSFNKKMAKIIRAKIKKKTAETILSISKRSKESTIPVDS